MDHVTVAEYAGWYRPVTDLPEGYEAACDAQVDALWPAVRAAALALGHTISADEAVGAIEVLALARERIRMTPIARNCGAGADYMEGASFGSAVTLQLRPPQSWEAGTYRSGLDVGGDGDRSPYWLLLVAAATVTGARSCQANVRENRRRGVLLDNDPGAYQAYVEVLWGIMARLAKSAAIAAIYTPPNPRGEGKRERAARQRGDSRRREEYAAAMLATLTPLRPAFAWSPA